MHRKDKKGNWDIEFKRELEAYEAKIITASVKHPQNNGKLGGFNQTYEKTRNDFTSF